MQEINKENKLVLLVQHLAAQLQNYTKVSELLIQDFLMKLFENNVEHLDLLNAQFTNFFLNDMNKLFLKNMFEIEFESLAIKKNVFDEFWKVFEIELKNLKKFNSYPIQQKKEERSKI